MAESVESEEISSSSSEWKTDSEELFVTCLNENSENKIAKPIKNYFDLFINTSLNHITIRYPLVSQPKNNILNWNSEQLFNATDLSCITFGVILPPNLRGKNSTNSQFNLNTLDDNKILKYVLSKYY